MKKVEKLKCNKNHQKAKQVYNNKVLKLQN